MKTKLTTMLVVTAMLLTAAAPPAFAATGSSSLDLDVTQDADGTATVTVTRNGTAVENASVIVTADETYAGTGNYTTDANGTVSSPSPALR
ncbi:hypothetical protein ACFQJD_09570 [Haloplanus sp. GCM10025708]|uniref:hypothetical protein n=1 Tax=Haloplanus sp. GCM10025708 TaxID=3252679 RepID=UPI0036088A9E